MSAQHDELARIAGELERYAQRAGLMAGPVQALVVDLWGCHAELVADDERLLGINGGMGDEVAVLRSWLESMRGSGASEVSTLAARALDEHDSMVAERPPWSDVGHPTEAL